MCGIFGFVSSKIDIQSEKVAASFAKSLHHRGPDDFGYKIHSASCIGNTRLSIIDIKSGHQPIANNESNVFVVQNGEIYNYIELREELIILGREFSTKSDTEVILNAYLEWGELFVNRLNGMFAIAILDVRKDVILIYRDRLGVKPLYFYKSSDTFYFSSEIKTFLKLDDFNSEPDNQAIFSYLHFNYVPLPSTIFKNVKHLQPGHMIKLNLNDPLNFSQFQYWRYADYFIPKNNISDNEILDNLDYLLSDAVNIRMRSDVEVGAFLSGGLDSSLVCAFMRNLVGNQVSIPVFSIGFKEEKYDESVYSKYIADKYNLNYNISILNPDILKYWPKTTYFNDQPHGDTSFIPTFLLSQFASTKNKVVLTGDGGDELLAGYDKYKLIGEYDLHSYFEKISVFDISLLNNILLESFKSTIHLDNNKKIISDIINQVPEEDDLNKALYFDVMQLLPGNNLVKPDKMAMANSLETRSPFLDYRLFEFFAGIKGSRKLQSNETKFFAKQMAQSHFSYEHIYRDKQMFTVPVGEWFKSTLKQYVNEILFDGRLESRKIFNINQLRKLVELHNSNITNYTREIRAIINLEIWYRIFIDEEQTYD